MIGVDITLPNLDRVQDAFRRQPERFIGNLADALQRVAFAIEVGAKRRAPVNKQSGGGNLRQSIQSRMTSRISGVVFASAKYAGYVHDGTRPHRITVRSARVLANPRTGQIFGKVVQHPGTRANPFMKNAVDQNKDFIERELNEAIDKSWDRV